MLGMGSIGPRNDDGVYCWRTNGYPEGRAVLAMLWRHLGPVKRRQAAAALAAVGEQYASGRVARRPPRSRSKVPPLAYRAVRGPHDDVTEARAWAAGFLDAEGCFGLARNGTRGDGLAWYRIRCSASQHGDVLSVPSVLVRLMAAVDLGRIERHGEPDDYKWLVEGERGVQRVLEVVQPWLGSVKRAQARRTLAAFTTQPAKLKPIRGDAERCKRGHPYDRSVTTKAGGTRAYCNACARLMERRKRAAHGIAPRQFKNVQRRYTE
jgi:hypothetical protein